MEDTLVLEKRGMDFYEGCPEKKVSDLGNFRLYGKLLGKDDYGIERFYELEITTHQRRKDNGNEIVDTWVDTWVDTCHYIGGECKRATSKCFYCNPYKKDLLKGINNIFGTNYKKIELKEVR